MIKNNLFHELEDSVNKIHIVNSEKLERNSVSNIIDKSVGDAIENIVTHIINSYPSLSRSKNVKEIAKHIEKFLNSANFGTFEYVQQTGRSIFRINHSLGTNGTEFLKKFLKRIFESCLKYYSFHIISNESYVCIVFR